MVLQRLTSAFGIVAMMGLAFALCPRERRRHIQLKTVGRGLLLLFVFSFLVLRTPVSRVFVWASDLVDALLDFSSSGSEFVFGHLVSDKASLGYIFAFQVLPTILFFAALMAALYHVGFMPFVIRQMASRISGWLGTSGAESFSTVSDIFVGQTEAPLVIKPYLPTLTSSELLACMVAGFATTAGGVLAAYVAMLRSFVPGIAGHLIACSVMCAPASLIVAKLILPESETPETLGITKLAVPRSSDNLLDAIVTGTSDGVRLAVNVGAMLVVFVALTALVNAVLLWVGTHAVGMPLTLERVLGWLFAPLAWLMGVPPEDVRKVGMLLGEKTVMNEFVAYAHMSRMLSADAGWLTERGRLITCYALCGFANFGSIGIQIAGYGALAPTRRVELSRLALRAMVGGLLATCMVACVAGVLL